MRSSSTSLLIILAVGCAGEDTGGNFAATSGSMSSMPPAVGSGPAPGAGTVGPQPTGDAELGGAPAPLPTNTAPAPDPAGTPTMEPLTEPTNDAMPPGPGTAPMPTQPDPVATMEDPMGMVPPFGGMDPPVGMGGASGDPPLQGQGGAMLGSGGAETSTGGASEATVCVAPENPESLGDFLLPQRPSEEQCAYCHGPDGEGGEQGPELRHPVEDFYTWVIRNGREHPDYMDEMPAFTEEEFDEDCMEAMFEFLSSFPKPTTGEALFMDYCANCHGDDGTGGVTDRDISAEPYGELLEHARDGAHAGEFDNRTEFMPVISGDILSDQEIQMIADYLGSL